MKNNHLIQVSIKLFEKNFPFIKGQYSQHLLKICAIILSLNLVTMI